MAPFTYFSLFFSGTLSPSAVHEALLQDQTRHLRPHSAGVLEARDDAAGHDVTWKQTQMMKWIFFPQNDARELKLWLRGFFFLSTSCDDGESPNTLNFFFVFFPPPFHFS